MRINEDTRKSRHFEQHDSQKPTNLHAHLLCEQPPLEFLLAWQRGPKSCHLGLAHGHHLKRQGGEGDDECDQDATFSLWTSSVQHGTALDR